MDISSCSDWVCGSSTIRRRCVISGTCVIIFGCLYARWSCSGSVKSCVSSDMASRRSSVSCRTWDCGSDRCGMDCCMSMAHLTVGSQSWDCWMERACCWTHSRWSRQSFCGMCTIVAVPRRCFLIVGGCAATGRPRCRGRLYGRVV